MRLFECRNGYTGYTYTRVYVWAPDIDKAHAMAEEAFREDAGEIYTSSYWRNVRCEELFNSDSTPFVTMPSDMGWVKDN